MSESSQPQPQSPPSYPLQERYASAKDFLAELSEYHGNDTYIVSPDKSMVLARCPVCPRRPREGVTRFKLMLTRCGGPIRYGWGVSAFCNCPDQAILAELVRMKADQLRRQADDLEATYTAPEAVENV